MYIPKSNLIEDPAVIAEFIDFNGFATVVTSNEGVPFASHLPVLHDAQTHQLRSHMARANEQWQHFEKDREILCIFHGPHAYISPSWYVSKVAVPTWNYATVHVYGIPEITDDPLVLRKIVDDTTEKYERKFPEPWLLDLPEETLKGLMGAIVGFSLKITRIEAKFKLGQNRSVEDQASMLQALAVQEDADSQKLAAFIQQTLSS